MQVPSLSYWAQEEAASLPGVWADVKDAFQDEAFGILYEQLDRVNTFRNTYVAHGEKTLDDTQEAWAALAGWLRCQNMMFQIGSVQREGRETERPEAGEL